jgi:hypothetical protein
MHVDCLLTHPTMDGEKSDGIEDGYYEASDWMYS